MQIRPVFRNAILLYSLIPSLSTVLQLAPILTTPIILRELVFRFVLRRLLSLDRMLLTRVLQSVSILPSSSTYPEEYVSIPVLQTISWKISREIV